MPVAACPSKMEDISLAGDEVLVILARRHLAGNMRLQRLSPEEIARYHAYVLEADRQRHLLAHGLKRQLLARFTDAAPETLQFRTGHAGKPALSCEEIHFNLSHSGDWVALAFSAGHAVGIDVEQARNLEYQNLLTLIAHPQDDPLFAHESPVQAFLSNWSMKEAVTKCLGLGLSMPFTSLWLNHGGNADFTCTGKDGTWHGKHFIRDDTHIAVAVPGIRGDTRFRMMEIGQACLRRL